MGSAWPEYVRATLERGGVVKGPGPSGPTMLARLVAQRIALGLLQNRLTETTTTRSFEIPAMGTSYWPNAALITAACSRRPDGVLDDPKR